MVARRESQTFRSPGDVAKAMGDAKSTVKRISCRTLEPGVGKKGFNAYAEGRESH